MRNAVVAEAKTWVGTPFLHQGRIKGRGVDCVGLVIGVAHELKLAEYVEVAYGRMPDPVRMGSLLNQYLDKIPRSKAQPGDILWMRFSRSPTHVAILSHSGIIHSYSEIGKCIEHRLDSVWESRIVGCYKYKGIVDLWQ